MLEVLSILLIVVGGVIVLFGARSMAQPRWNRPPLFWSPVSTVAVFGSGLALFVLGVLLL